MTLKKNVLKRSIWVAIIIIGYGGIMSLYDSEIHSYSPMETIKWLCLLGLTVGVTFWKEREYFEISILQEIVTAMYMWSLYPLYHRMDSECTEYILTNFPEMYTVKKVVIILLCIALIVCGAAKFIKCGYSDSIGKHKKRN